MSHPSTILKNKNHLGHTINFGKILLNSTIWASIIGGAFLGNNIRGAFLGNSIHGGCGAIIGGIIGGLIGFNYVSKGSRGE